MFNEQFPAFIPKSNRVVEIFPREDGTYQWQVRNLSSGLITMQGCGYDTARQAAKAISQELLAFGSSVLPEIVVYEKEPPEVAEPQAKVNATWRPGS